MPCPFAISFQILYGSLAEAIALSATAPLQRCQWTMQVMPSLDVDTCTQHILHQSKHEYWTYWQGNGLAIGYSSVEKALRLFLQDYCMEHYASILSGNQLPKDKKQQLTEEQRCIKWNLQQKCMLWSHIASMVILYPFSFALTHWVVTTEHTNQATGIVPLWRQTMQTSGAFAIFRGMGMIISNHLMKSHLTELIMERLRRFRPLNRNLQSVIAVTVAGCFAYPLDTLGRRLQLSSSSESTMIATHALFAGMGVYVIKNTMYQGILEIYHSESVSDWFRKFAMKLFH